MKHLWMAWVVLAVGCSSYTPTVVKTQTLTCPPNPPTLTCELVPLEGRTLRERLKSIQTVLPAYHQCAEVVGLWEDAWRACQETP